MNTLALRVAIALVRAWTHAYTAGLSPLARDRRREEIASDLWELTQDRDRGGDMASALRVLARLVFGIRHDLAWRMEQRTTRRSAVRLMVALAALTVVLVVLRDQALRPRALPPVPPAPPPDILTLVRRAPLLPPPPPPPPRPGEDPDLWRRLLVPPGSSGVPR